MITGIKNIFWMIFDNHNKIVENWSETHPGSCIDQPVSYSIECHLSHQSHTVVCIILNLNIIPNSAFGKKICMLNLAIFFPWPALDQTVFTLSHHRRWRVLSSLCPAVCPSVCLSVIKDITALTFWGFQLSAWNFVRWCTVPWSRSLLKMAMLCQFLHVPWNFEIFHNRFFWPGLGDNVNALAL